MLLNITFQGSYNNFVDFLKNNPDAKNKFLKESEDNLFIDEEGFINDHFENLPGKYYVKFSPTSECFEVFEV